MEGSKLPSFIILHDTGCMISGPQFLWAQEGAINHIPSKKIAVWAK